MHDAPRHHINTGEKYGESLEISSQVRVPVRLLYIALFVLGTTLGRVSPGGLQFRDSGRARDHSLLV